MENEPLIMIPTRPHKDVSRKSDSDDFYDPLNPSAEWVKLQEKLNNPTIRDLNSNLNRSLLEKMTSQQCKKAMRYRADTFEGIVEGQEKFIIDLAEANMNIIGEMMALEKKMGIVPKRRNEIDISGAAMLTLSA